MYCLLSLNKNSEIHLYIYQINYNTPNQFKVNLLKENVMKSLRLALIATFVALAMGSFAQAYSGNSSTNNKLGIQLQPPTKIINITLYQAIQNPGLEAAIMQQVTPDMIRDHSNSALTFNVSFDGYIFIVTGSLAQWQLFMKLGSPSGKVPRYSTTPPLGTGRASQVSGRVNQILTGNL